MNKKKIYNISLLAIFLAIGVLLNYVENLLPVLIPVPGVKLGIANTIGLIVLYFFDRKRYALLGFLRVILVSVLFMGLFTSGFLLSLSGWFLSTLVCIALSFNKKISIYTLSVAGAIFHSIGQIICASILYSSVYILTYLSILVFVGVITGLTIAFLSSIIIKRLSNIINLQ